MPLQSAIPRKSAGAVAPVQKPGAKAVEPTTKQAQDAVDQQSETMAGETVDPSGQETVPGTKRKGRPKGSTNAPKPAAAATDGDVGGPVDKKTVRARLKELEALAKQSRKDEAAKLSEVGREFAAERVALKNEYDELNRKLNAGLF